MVFTCCSIFFCLMVMWAGESGGLSAHIQSFSLFPLNTFHFIPFPVCISSHLYLPQMLLLSSFILFSLSLWVSRLSYAIAGPNSDSTTQVAPAREIAAMHHPLCRLTIEKFHYSPSHVSGQMSKREEKWKLESKRRDSRNV